MAEKVKISVIMSVYNSEHYLKEAIESILNQTFEDFEFIIVDDSSTDRSLDTIESFQDDRIIVIKNELNIGLTKSLNKALKIAQGEYIARQDADDISLLNRFEKQVHFLEKNKDVGIVGTSFYLINEEGVILQEFKKSSEVNKSKLLKDNELIHGSVMFKKNLVQSKGNYNEFMKYCQDYELWLRMSNFCEIKNLIDPLYKLRRHGGSIQFKKRKESVLYRLFALKVAKGDLTKDQIVIIKNKGIMEVYNYLDKSERSYLHKSLADVRVYKNDLKGARSEYKNILLLDPFKPKIYLNLFFSFFGKKVMDTVVKFYTYLRM